MLNTIRSVMVRPPHIKPDDVRRYGLAVVAVVLAVVLNLLLNPTTDSPFVLFLTAVLISAWLGGFGPGLVALTLSAGSSAYLFLTPHYSFWLDGWKELARLVVFLATGFLSCQLAAWLHDRQRSLSEELAERKRVEARLRHSEERLRLILSGITDYVISLLDLDGRVLSWNPGGKEIRGYREEEILHRHFSCCYGPEDLDTGQPERALRVAAAEGRFEDEGWRVRKDGTRFWANMIITALYDEAGQVKGFVQITRDSTERKQNCDRLNDVLALEHEARLQAEQALKTRDEFLSIAAHEFKTPITILSGCTQLLVRELGAATELTPKGDRLFQSVLSQVRRVHRMTYLLLDLSRLHRGNFTINTALVDLTELVCTMVEEFRMALDSHTLRCTAPPGPVIIEGDLVRLEQVLYNLLQNAVKYSPQGGEIDIRLATRGAQVVIEIEDKGIGIPAADQAQLFTKYHRAHNAEGHQIKGLGLGLYLVKKIINEHHGAIEVQSEEGAGTTFMICLPLHEAMISVLA